MIALAFAAVLVFRHVGQNESVRDARELTKLLGRDVVEPALTDRVVAGDPAALDTLDDLVRTRVLRNPVVRVKIWEADGRIIYSDEGRLIGLRYQLASDESKALRTGGIAADASDLSRPENRFERARGNLLEVYVPVHTPSGRPLLFEAYLRASDVTASGRRVWIAFAPALLGTLLLIWLVQLPLAASLARRLQRGQRERETLLLGALDASDSERRRIAADLHDGVVQDLAGTSIALATDAERVRFAEREELEATLREGADVTRQAMRQLRSLLVEIYPPNLRTAGLEAALSDLLARVASRGLETELEIDLGQGLREEVDQLLFRGAQEALRNVVEHAEASRVVVHVRRLDDWVELAVSDDGRGVQPEQLEQRRQQGHIGLVLLEERARAVGGRLELGSAPGEGTSLVLRVPA